MKNREIMVPNKVVQLTSKEQVRMPEKQQQQPPVATQVAKMSTVNQKKSKVDFIPAFNSSQQNRQLDVLSIIQARMKNNDFGVVLYPYCDILETDTNVTPIVEDLAVIVCLWGQNEEQIKAAKVGLKALINTSNPTPKHIVVVEAQMPEEAYHLDKITNKLVEDQVIYLKEELCDDNKNMFVKEPMWNIGAKYLIENHPYIEKFIFLDIDCVFCNATWAISCTEALNEFDVISPHSFSYYSDQDDNLFTRSLQPSVGESWLQIGRGDGHAGFGIGMTKDFYVNRIEEIPTATVLGGDTWFWFLVFGHSRREFWRLNAVYNYGNITGYGMLPFPKVGATGETIVHIYHGKMNTRFYGGKRVISRACTTVPYEDIGYIDNYKLPVWNKEPAGILIKNCIQELKDWEADEKNANVHIDENVLCRNIYDKVSEDFYGSIDEEHPLIIATSLRSGGPYTRRHVLLIRDLYKKYCLTPHKFMCISDIEIGDGVETIPFEMTTKEAPYYYCQIELFRNIYPKNASVLTTDLDAIPIREFTMHRAPENEMSMGMELHNWPLCIRTLWNGGITYFRGDFEFAYKAYRDRTRKGGKHQPFFSFISSQEFVNGELYAHGHAITDLLSHLQFEFYQKPGCGVLPHSKLVHFLFKPKPWDLPQCPDWLPMEAWSVGGGTAYETAKE